MFQKLKPHLKWIVPTGIVILLVLFFVCQSPQVISATVSPEVIVKGQNQEITVTVVVKPRWYNLPILRVVMVERGNANITHNLVNDLPFKGKATNIGWLHKTGKDNNGNYVYQNVFGINHPMAETVQIQVRNLLNKPIAPQYTPASWHDIRGYIPSMRLAVSTRKFNLPSDPGKENDKTFDGIDADHDGLRDDLQREIFFAYPESERVRKAMGESWKFQQKKLLDAINGDGELVNKDIRASLRSSDCGGAFKINRNAGPIGDILENLFIEGDIKRAEANITADKLSGPLIWRQQEPLELNCDFNWQSLPD